MARAAAPGSQEISHGTAKTEVDGSFEVQFVAKPDSLCPKRRSRRSPFTCMSMQLTALVKRAQPNEASVSVTRPASDHFGRRMANAG